METLIQLKNVEKSYQEGDHLFCALSEINLEIHKGDFLVLSGPSGSGKTTILNMLGCLDRPTSGEVRFEGNIVSHLPQSQLAQFRLHKIGFIFQDYNLIPTLTACENMEYTLWLQGVKAPERRRRAQELAERFGIGQLLFRRPSQLSRGQQQRVAVARALIHQPRVVLGDELTANLDHKTGEALMDFLKSLNKEQGVTFIYATHDPVMIKRADRIIRVHDGKIVNPHSVPAA